jgi:acyl carrier protein
LTERAKEAFLNHAFFSPLKNKQEMKAKPSVESFFEQRSKGDGEKMSIENVEVKVKEIVAEQLSVDIGELEPSKSFINDLGADSLDIVELVMAMEEEFDVEIPDEDAEKIQTLGDAIKYVAEHN